MKKLLISLAALFMITGAANAQVAIRSNLATLPFGVLTVGTEFALGQKWTLGFDLMANLVDPYDFYEMKYGGLLMGEARYYFCEAFNGHHIGLYGMVGYHEKISFTNEFLSNIIAYCPEFHPHLPGESDPIEKVRTLWAGLSYGYYIKLGHGWGLDISIGGGLSVARYRVPGDKTDYDSNLHFGVSRVAIDLSYKF